MYSMEIKNCSFNVGTKELNLENQINFNYAQILFFSGLAAWIYFEVKDKTQFFFNITLCLQQKKKKKVSNSSLWSVRNLVKKNLEESLAQFDLDHEGNTLGYSGSKA